MDERKNHRKQRRIKDEIEASKDSLLETPDADCDEFRKIIQTSAKNTLSHLDELIQSSSPKSNKRQYFELFRALIEDNARSSESIVYLFEYVINLRASILLLSAEVEKTKGRTAKDVKQLKTKLNHLLNSPAMIEIGKILQNIQTISKERESVSTKNPTIEYLR